MRVGLRMLMVAGITGAMMLGGSAAFASQNGCSDPQPDEWVWIEVVGTSQVALDAEYGTDGASVQSCGSLTGYTQSQSLGTDLNDLASIEHGDRCVLATAIGCAVRSFEVVTGGGSDPLVHGDGFAEIFVDIVRTCLVAAGETCG